MKTYRKNIDGILLGDGMKIAKEKLKDKEAGSVFVLTAYNGAKAFKKTSDGKISELEIEKEHIN